MNSSETWVGEAKVVWRKVACAGVLVVSRGHDGQCMRRGLPSYYRYEGTCGALLDVACAGTCEKTGPDPGRQGKKSSTTSSRHCPCLLRRSR